MTRISNTRYLLEQAKRKFTPSPYTIPGLGALERRLRGHQWKEFVFAEPPPGSNLKPVLGDSGLPVLGHLLEVVRSGPDYILDEYRKHGPVWYSYAPALGAVLALGPEATQIVLGNRDKDYSQRAWDPVIGPFFKRGLMMMDFDEHLFHRRIMQEAFTRTRLAGYVEHMDSVTSAIIDHEWVANDSRFLINPAMLALTLEIASVVFMGHDTGTSRELVNTMNHAFITCSRAGNAIVRGAVPPLRWWRGLRARKTLEDYFAARVGAQRRSGGDDMFTVLCNATDEDGQRFSDTDVVNHMIFLMMAAHDTSTTTMTNMAYLLAAHPDWQHRCREESARIGYGPLTIDALDKLETYDLVMYETLRLMTPPPMIFRQAVRDTDLLGHYIPAGTNVVTWPSVNHRLPELWTDPWKFDPGRFAEPRSEHKNHRYAFSPFGGGAHKCIGMVFGQLEIKTAMHRLLEKYQLELVQPNYTPQLDYTGMPAPLDGLPMMLRPLN